MVAVDEVAGIMLDDNIFYYDRVDFSYSYIGNSEFSMKGCQFIKCNICFAHTIFGNNDIYFNEMIFDPEQCEMVFPETSATDKANQLIILLENYQNEGEPDNADAAYVPSKRYQSTGSGHGYMGNSMDI